MNVVEAILARRSVRRFRQEPISFEILTRCVNSARLAPCGRNKQRLQFVVVDEENLAAQVFVSLSWAGYIKPRWSPAREERPTAYIVIVCDRLLVERLGIDIGTAAQNILLTAVDTGLGCCPVGSIDKQKVRTDLDIPESQEIALIIALGFPAEQPRAVEFKGSVKYWRDAQEVLNVPKKDLRDVMHHNKYKGKS